MAETENETKPQKAETSEPQKFTILVLLACVLSAGSLIWTTYSLLDFFQVGGIDLAHVSLRDLNPVGLSAAATADVAWSLTMVAAYRGVRLMSPKVRGKSYDLLPWIGWAEVLFVAFLLVRHGSSMGNGAAAFAGALPILTKVSWTMALADLKDPTAPTDEEMQQIASTRRKANVKLEKIKATEAEHQADLAAKRRAYEAALADARHEAQQKKLEKQTAYELEKMQLTSDHELTAMKRDLATQLQMDDLDGRMKVQMKREEHDFEMSLRRPPIRGEIVSRQGLPLRQITVGSQQDQGVGLGVFDLAAEGLSLTEQQQAQTARDYYTIDAQHNGAVTKAAFAKSNGIHPPRVSEATKRYSVEWFVERGLATWMETQD